MQNHAILYVAISLICVFTRTNGQWTPDPFCPYPSVDATRYRYYGNCSIFWECFEGTKYVLNCDEGLEFSEAFQKCVEPEIAQCDPYAPTTRNPDAPTYPTHSPTSEPPVVGPDCSLYPPEESVFFPDPDDCTKYFWCWDGTLYVELCPAGLWWNQRLETCDEPGDYCYNQTSPTTPPPNNDYCSSYPTDQIVYLPHPTDCTRFIVCYGGVTYIETCPDGEWWHQENRECDVPGDYCSNQTPPPITSTPPNNDYCSPYPPEQVVYLPYPGDCTRFVVCFNGEGYVETCPTGQWWHQEIDECDTPGDYCQSQTSPPPTHPPGGPSCELYPPDQEYFFPNTEDCSRYYVCWGGELYDEACPEGLWWNQALRRCDDPGDYCYTQTATPPTTPPPTSGPQEDPRCVDGTTSYWPHPFDCHRFIECNANNSYDISCPPNLYFSDEQKQCVDAKYSECCLANPTTCS